MCLYRITEFIQDISAALFIDDIFFDSFKFDLPLKIDIDASIVFE